MSTKLYVGNLSFQSTEGELQELFSEFGKVISAEIIMDRMTNRSRGFGFVTMESNDDAQNAIRMLHGKSINGRDLTVNEARAREERAPRRSFSGSGNGN